MSHGDPKNPKKNPHPVKRYEVTATVDPSLKWDAVKGYVFFEVTNVSCVPEDKFLGARNTPNTESDFEMTRVDEKTWRGYFYRDSFLDEDYFDQGVCHWDVTGVTPSFKAHGEEFNAGMVMKNGRMWDSDARVFFKKSEYFNYGLTGDGALQSAFDSPDVLQHPEAFFPITVAIKEATP